jgi:hypothetical protein
MAKRSSGLSDSAKLINRMHAKGTSYSSIGKSLGRDSSFISQIAHGKKKGTNLTGALKDMAAGRKVTAPPARRTTKAGTLAKVRRGSLRDKGALVMTAPLKASDETWKKTLKQFQKQNKKVMASLTFTQWRPYTNSKTHKQTVNIYAHGRDPQAIIDSASAAGQTIEEYMIDQVKVVYKPDQAEGFKGLAFSEAGDLLD